MPTDRNLFCCSTEIMSSHASLSLNPLLRTLSCSLMPHIHPTILISACWSATSFPFLTGQVSLPCNILLLTQLLYNLPLTIYIIIESAKTCVRYLLGNGARHCGKILHADACRPCAGPLLGLMWIGVVVGKKMNIAKLCLHFCCYGSTATAICCYI